MDIVFPLGFGVAPYSSPLQTGKALSGLALMPILATLPD
jgi:hypothetical protein